MFLADLHLHSRYSDGECTIGELIDIYGKLGYGAIAITDHLCESQTILGKGAKILKRTLTPHTFHDYLQELAFEAKRAWKSYQLLVLPGVEFTKNYIANSRSYHILGIGLKNYINPNLGLMEILNEIRLQGGLSVAAHPVSTRQFEKQTYYLWDQREKLRGEFDAWEAASGIYLSPEVQQSGLPIIASSDLHKRKQLSSWKTAFEGPRSIENVIESVRRQNLSLWFHEINWREFE